MIANLINVIIGLWLAYISIFGIPAPINKPWTLVVAGLVIAGLARIARRSDYAGWQSATNFVLGVVLVIATLTERMIPTSPLVTFWIQLWVGLTVSSLALWALLYRPEPHPDLSKAAR